MKNITGIIFAFILVCMLLTSCTAESIDNGAETKSESDETVAEKFSDTENESQQTSETTATEITPYNPIFSAEGGVYAEAISVELSVPQDSVDVYCIRYTTNGDEPTAESTKYTEPILVLAAKESVVIRAACFSRNGTIKGNIITNTYVKSLEKYSGMVVSISCDDDYLNDSKSGIITHPTAHGKEWERASHVEIIDSDGTRVINQDCGLRIFGGSSRGLEQKSFKLVARKSSYYNNDIRYDGAGKFRYALFDNAYNSDGEILDYFERLILRNGGNDSLQSTAADPTSMNLLRDGVVNNFAIEACDNVVAQASRLVTVFLNGKYYGVLDMKEDIGDDFLADYLSDEQNEIDNSNFVVVKSELDTSRHCSKHSDGGSCRFCNVWFYYETDADKQDELDELTALLKKAAECTDSDYDKVFAEVSEKIDIDNFMQYMALNLYVCNTDWPHNNVRIWRYTGESVDGISYTDGKWRFTTRDEDFAFGRYECLVLPEIYTMADTDTFSRMLGNYYSGSYKYKESTGYYPDSLYLQGLGNFLLKNDSFRSEFEQFCKMLVSDEYVALLKNEMDDYVAQCDKLISAHIERWNGTISGSYTYKKWNKANEKMYQWLEERPAYFLQYLEECLSHYE